MHTGTIADAETTVAIARAALDRAQRRNVALGRLEPADQEERLAIRDALLGSIARVQRAKIRLAIAMHDLADAEEAEREGWGETIIEDRRDEPWAMATVRQSFRRRFNITLPDLIA